MLIFSLFYGLPYGNLSSMNDLLSTSEVGKILKITRHAVQKRIKNKTLKAIKIGRNYAIPRDEVLRVLGDAIGEESKKEIDRAITKAIGEYRDVFKKLGSE
jgi:excisionase family DNA binding protein